MSIQTDHCPLYERCTERLGEAPETKDSKQYYCTDDGFMRLNEKEVLCFEWDVVVQCPEGGEK